MIVRVQWRKGGWRAGFSNCRRFNEMNLVGFIDLEQTSYLIVSVWRQG